MKKSISTIFILTLLSCSSIRYVEFDVDKTINFKKFRTYAWVPSHDQGYADQRYNNQIIENNIKSYAADAIVAKGLKLNIDSPDILFFYDLQIEKGTHTVQTPIYSHPHNFMPPPMMPIQPGIGVNPMIAQQQMMQQQMMMQQWMTPQIIGYETRQIPFKNGTLTIVAIERATNRMIWRGWSESCVTDPLNYRDNLERKIQLIFRNFPLVRP